MTGIGSQSVLLNSETLQTELHANIYIICFCYIGERTWWHHEMKTYCVFLALLRGIHQSAVEPSHKSPAMGTFHISLVLAWTIENRPQCMSFSCKDFSWQLSCWLSLLHIISYAQWLCSIHTRYPTLWLCEHTKSTYACIQTTASEHIP